MFVYEWEMTNRPLQKGSKFRLQLWEAVHNAGQGGASRKPHESSWAAWRQLRAPAEPGSTPQRQEAWKLTSDVRQTPTHSEQPCLTCQDQTRLWEQQAGTLREPTAATEENTLLFHTSNQIP